MRQLIRQALTLSIFLSLVACAAIDGGPGQISTLPGRYKGMELATLEGVYACRQGLAERKSASVAELDSSAISVLSWNIKKGELSGWTRDLHKLASNKQLILLQEAASSMQLSTVLTATSFQSFAPGYVTVRDITGVVTFSQIEPLANCRLLAMEPWLGTPKATNITQYALSNTDKTLLVANIHAVNFSFGLKHYRAQLEAIVEVLAAHEGPIIFSGDFNTWRRGRQKVLSEVVARLDLKPIYFEEDHRVRFLGLALDHVFVGGLQVMATHTHEVQSSDHNPISLTFSM